MTQLGAWYMESFSIYIYLISIYAYTPSLQLFTSHRLDFDVHSNVAVAD